MFFLQILETITCQKITRKKFKKKLSILHRLGITQICIEDFIIFFSKFRGAHHTSCNWKLNLVLLHLKVKIKFYTHWNPYWVKNYMGNCLFYLTVNLYFLFRSIILNQLRSLSLKSELQFLPVSKMGKFHTVH